MATKKPKIENEDQSQETTGYQEWEVKIDRQQAEKIKISRKSVKITEEEAEILNRGVLTGGNTFAKMYFKPE